MHKAFGNLRDGEVVRVKGVKWARAGNEIARVRSDGSLALVGRMRVNSQYQMFEWREEDNVAAEAEAEQVEAAEVAAEAAAAEAAAAEAAAAEAAAAEAAAAEAADKKSKDKGKTKKEDKKKD